MNEAEHTGIETGFNVVSCELHTARRLRTYCTHSPTALSRCTADSTTYSLDPNLGRREGNLSLNLEAKWSLNLDPDPDRIRIQGPMWRAPIFCSCRILYYILLYIRTSSL